MHGLAHPVTGLDHAAAMVAVGLWAAQRGGRSVLVVPLSFMAAMAAGALMGAYGIALPFVEAGIAASVLVLGLLITAAVRLPPAASGTLVGLFALLHGHAHGSELPGMMSGLAYGLGFVLSTGLLHLCGIGIGLTAQKVAGPRLVRCAGSATAAIGIWLCLV
jgi:urease accessory protein